VSVLLVIALITGSGILPTDWQFADMAWPAAMAKKEIVLPSDGSLESAAEMVEEPGFEDLVPRGMDGDGREERTKERAGFTIMA